MSEQDDVYSRLQKSELKNQALLERVSNLTAQHENQAADYRVEITLLAAQLEEAKNRINELEAPTDVQEEDPDPTPSK